MLRNDFEKGIQILEARFSRSYKKETVERFWEELQKEFAGAFLSVARTVNKGELALPGLDAIQAALADSGGADDRGKRERADRRYYDDQKSRAEAAERVVGQSFEFFLGVNNGDHTLAAYYFGQAFHKMTGNQRTAAAYERLTEGRERFLANPKAALERMKKERKKAVAENIKVGEALDSMAGQGR